MTATKIAFGIFSSLNLAVWGFFSWIGLASRLSPVQMLYYLYIPLLMFGIAIASFGLAVRFRRYDVSGTLAFFMIFAVIPYMMIYGGGV